MLKVFHMFYGWFREKVQFIRNEGPAGLTRLSSDADLVMLLRLVCAPFATCLITANRVPACFPLPEIRMHLSVYVHYHSKNSMIFKKRK